MLSTFETTTNQKQGGLRLSAFLSFSFGAVLVDLLTVLCLLGAVFWLGVFFCFVLIFVFVFVLFPLVAKARRAEKAACSLAPYKDGSGLPDWVGTVGLCYLLRPY